MVARGGLELFIGGSLPPMTLSSNASSGLRCHPRSVIKEATP